MNRRLAASGSSPGPGTSRGVQGRSRNRSVSRTWQLAGLDPLRVPIVGRQQVKNHPIADVGRVATDHHLAALDPDRYEAGPSQHPAGRPLSRT
jgi:hypothetical protein